MSQYLFSDLKVLDVATVIAAPAAAMMLADFGASVIKIEQPGTGDMLRMLSSVPTTPDAPSDWFWQMDGRNKRSLTLNLKHEDGMAVLHRLIEEADVYITNQPFPVRDSLGLNYEDVKALNPSIIYASLSGYGEQGPERSRKAFDQLAYWGRSGLMDLMRQHGTLPTQALPGMGDHPTAVSIYAGVVTALLHRERSGEGGMVHTSLLANGLWSVSSIAQGAMAGGDMPAYRERNATPTALWRVYEAADGRSLQFNMVRTEEDFALTFAGLDALHLLEDERFLTFEKMSENRDALAAILQEIIAGKTSAEWLELFHGMNVDVHLVGRVEDTPTDPQILANRMAVVPDDPEIDVPLILNHPVQVTSVPQVGPRRAPDLGEHTDEILKELGYDDASIATLRERGAV